MTAADSKCRNPQNPGEALECLGLSWKGFGDECCSGKQTDTWKALTTNHRIVYMTVDIALALILLTILALLALRLAPKVKKP